MTRRLNSDLIGKFSDEKSHDERTKVLAQMFEALSEDLSRLESRLDAIAADHATFFADREASAADREAIKAQLALDRQALRTELTALRAAMLDPEQMKTVVGALRLAGRADEFADMIAGFMNWLRRAALWIAPLLAVVVAFAAARDTLASWWADLFNGGPK